MALEYSLQDIGTWVHADHETVERWLAKCGIEPIRTEIKGGKKFRVWGLNALQAAEKMTKAVINAPAPASNGNGDGGVTNWAHAKLKQETIKLEMENEQKRKLAEKEIMLTEDHYRQVSAIINRIEQVPGKARSELGLSDAHVTGLRRMLDECRNAAAEEIEKEP
jgi:hypothetical protein